MTQNAFEKLSEKYGRCEVADLDNLVDQEERPKNQPGIERWQDSEPITMLSALLKEFGADQGISLAQTRDGRPVLSFQPDLEIEEKNPERFDIAMHAAHLKDEARKDLEQLIFIGALTLPENKGIWL